MPRPIFATKSIDALRAEAEGGAGLQRSLGALDLTLLGIGAIMGTGIFVVTGQAAATYAGPAVILSFLVAGVAAALAALCYSEMAAMIPVAGSAYTYAYAAMGELAAFMIGWDLALAYTVSVGLVSVGWSGYMVAVVQDLLGWQVPTALCSPPLAFNEAAGRLELTGAWVNLPAVLIIAGLAAVQLAGVQKSARLNAVIVAVKIGVVALFVAATVGHVDARNWRPFIPDNDGTFGHFGLSGVLQAATIVFVSYIGFDAVSVAAQEARRPQRDVPIGILASLAVCTACYMAVALVLTGVVPYTQLAVPHPIAVGISVTGLGWLTTVVEVGALAGLSSVILALLLALPRVMMAMARDGLLPAAAARVHPRFGTPYVTTLLCAGACAVCGGLLPIDLLSEMVSINTLFAFVLVSVGVMVLRLRRPEAPRPFRVPGGPFAVPLLAAGLSGMLICTASVGTLVRLGVWMALGGIFYAVYCRRHSHLRLAAAATEQGPALRAGP